MKPLAVVFWLFLFSGMSFPVQGMPSGSGTVRDSGTADSIVLLQSRLRHTETAVLSYSSGAGELRLDVVTEETSRSLRLAAGSVLLSRILALKSSLQTGDSFDRRLAYQLYQKLVAPAKPFLQGITHLIIVPDRTTGLIPFEALVPDTGSQRFLLHDYAISYSCGLRALIRSGAPPSGYDRQKVLAVAPFNVPSSEKEIMNIKADHVLGQAASLEHFAKKASDYAIIHLATYATLTGPRRSFIDFSPGKDNRAASSRLFVRDIPRMNLEKVNLVVLSPCPTGAPGYTPIPRLFTTARAFARAGCPNFITSMWTTERESASKISMKLHQYIHKGYGYAYALRKARIDYLENPAVDGSMKSPAYWAGFVLLGEINTTPRSHKIFYYFALAFTILVVALILRKRNQKRPHADCPQHPETICQSHSA